MNEALFGLQVFSVFGFTALMARQGKEGLVGWMGLLVILANLFVSKQIQLFGLSVTASDVFAVGLFLSLNILQEFWGLSAAKQAMQGTFWFQLFFLLISQIHLQFIPNDYDLSQAAFKTILGAYPRILFASIFTLWVTQRWDSWFFNFLKVRERSHSLTSAFSSFTARNILALLVSQALDTLLFTFLALYGSVGDLFEVMAMSFAIKVSLILLTPFLTTPIRRYVLTI